MIKNLAGETRMLMDRNVCPSYFSKLMPPVLFKPDLKEIKQTDITEEPENAETVYEGPFLVCRQCLALITSPEEKIVAGGSHQHAFANPHGTVFEIGCFRNAWGCGAVGAPTNEFTWFAGYFWQVAICGSCLSHMGWRFTSPDAAGFYGLILDNLMESDII